jgi:hypothetical protein
MSDDWKQQNRVFAESYMLMCIDELDESAARRLMREVEGSPYKSPDDWRRDFEASESVSQAQFDAIRELWHEQKTGDASLTPAAFVAEWAEQVFPDMTF